MQKSSPSSRGPRQNMPPRSFATPTTKDAFKGTFIVGKGGLCFVKDIDGETIIDIPAHEVGHAFSRDTVSGVVTDKKKGIGRVTEIIRSAKAGFTGHVESRGGTAVFIPTDLKDPEIPLESVDDLPSPHTKVYVEITRWEGTEPFGTIKKILGEEGTNNVEMQSIAIEKGFSSDYPPAVEEEAEKLVEKHSQITPDELAVRRDMRDTTVFTIDPEDAKDFDDALSYKELPGGMLEIGIHIADVSHYVRPNTPLDRESRERTTSVYLVDRTIPMLPEELSNNLCSLRQGEEKCTFSAIFTIDPNDGSVHDEWFGRTVIKSSKRFTYEEAQSVLDAGEGPFFKELLSLNTIAKKYTDERKRAGAMDFDQDEVKFVLDENGVPLKVILKQRHDTNKLIEEFMLLANRRVAEFMSKDKNSIFVYRIHDLPNPDRMADLGVFLKNLGYTVTFEKGIIPPKQLQKIIKEAKTHEEKDAMQTAIIRSMAKAIYSTDNIGHYGLSFDYYTHFTSPIRRYPDIMVHRLLEEKLQGRPIPQEKWEDYKMMCNRSSERERDASEAEWASIKYKQVEYMSSRIGQEFEGTITGMTEHGLFVSERETKSDGFVRLSDIPGDYWTYHDKTRELVGTKTGKKYRVGMIVKIKIKETNLEKRMIDYTIV